MINNEAIHTTFKHRNTEKDLENFDNIITEISNSDIMKIRWKSYQEKFYYAKKVTFEDTINSIKNIALIA